MMKKQGFIDFFILMIYNLNSPLWSIRPFIIPTLIIRDDGSSSVDDKPFYQGPQMHMTVNPPSQIEGL